MIRKIRDPVTGEGLHLLGETAVVILEKGPVEKAHVRHDVPQLPSNTGFCLAAKASNARR